jgi:hypothetical protein
MTAIVAARQFSLALKSDGTVWAWGDNSYGQLSGVAASGSTTPIQVIGLSNIAAIGSGNWHSLAIQAPDAPSTTGCIPAGSASEVPCDTSISWLPVPFVNHDFQLSKDSGFTTLLADIKNSTSNSYIPTAALAPATTYYWRVRSRAINLTSAWVKGSFTTVGGSSKQGSTTVSPSSPSTNIITSPPPANNSTVLWVAIIVLAVVAIALAAILIAVTTRRRS